MTSRPIDNDARHAARERRLGPDAACCLCGERNIDVLTRVPRSLLEEHHVAGYVNDADLTAVVCLNHHALLTAAMADLGVALRRSLDRSALDRLQAILAGLAAFFAALADRLGYYAQGVPFTNPLSPNPSMG